MGRSKFHHEQHIYVKKTHRRTAIDLLVYSIILGMDKKCYPTFYNGCDAGIKINQWSYSTVRKYSKPYLRTLGNNPRDTLP